MPPPLAAACLFGQFRGFAEDNRIGTGLRGSILDNVLHDFEGVAHLQEPVLRGGKTYFPGHSCGSGTSAESGFFTSLTVHTFFVVSLQNSIAQEFDRDSTLEKHHLPPAVEAEIAEKWNVKSLVLYDAEDRFVEWRQAGGRGAERGSRDTTAGGGRVVDEEEEARATDAGETNCVAEARSEWASARRMCAWQGQWEKTEICFRTVQEYERQNHVRYRWLLRVRVDLAWLLPFSGSWHAREFVRRSAGAERASGQNSTDNSLLTSVSVVARSNAGLPDMFFVVPGPAVSSTAAAALFHNYREFAGLCLPVKQMLTRDIVDATAQEETWDFGEEGVGLVSRRWPFLDLARGAHLPFKTREDCAIEKDRSPA
eukprot:g17660.t1